MANIVEDTVLNINAPLADSYEVSVTSLLGGPSYILKVNRNNIENAHPYKFYTGAAPFYIFRTKEGRKVFQHLRVDGDVDYLPYDDEWEEGVCFINVGWRGDNGHRYYRVDPYTGDNILIDETVP